jgi:hypothetical protein
MPSLMVPEKLPSIMMACAATGLSSDAAAANAIKFRDINPST